MRSTHNVVERKRFVFLMIRRPPRSTRNDTLFPSTDVLQKMVKQRRESIAMFEQGGRQELADIEAAEVAVIEDFLPAQLSDDDAMAAITAIVVELGAERLKDMGQVMAAVKDRPGSQLHLSKASG